MPELPDHARPECRMYVAIVSLAIPLATEENFQPLPSRMHRDEQQVRIFVALARPKWRNSPTIQRWCISQTRRLEKILYESGEAAQDERTTTV